MIRSTHRLSFCAGLLFLFIAACQLPHSWAQGTPKDFVTKDQKKAGKAAEDQIPKLPEHLDADQVDRIIAGLSDEQVRRLLINELKKSATKEKATEGDQPDGFEVIIARLGQAATLLHQRVKDVRTGATSVPEYLPEAFRSMRPSGGIAQILRILLVMAVLYLAGWFAEWLFHKCTISLRTRMERDSLIHWREKAKRLFAELLMDLISITVFSVTNIILFLIFFDDHAFYRLVIITYLVLILVLRGIFVAARFLLSPSCPSLRMLPWDDNRTHYIYAWVVRIAVTAALGSLVTDLLQLEQIGEAVVLIVATSFGLAVLGMVIYLLVANRRTVSSLICTTAKNSPAGVRSFSVQLADHWHLLAISYLLLLFGVWVLYLFLGQADLVFPVFALFLSCPIYLVLNGIAQRFLNSALGIVRNAPPNHLGTEAQGSQMEGLTYGTPVTPTPETELAQRAIPLIRAVVRLCIAATVILWVLGLWGFEMSLEETVAKAGLKIVLAITLTYVSWRLIEGIINRRLKELQPSVEKDEEQEEGGAGGSRIGTLLHLLRKFLLIVLLIMVTMIILSSLGVDIGPLMAGAGVVGLAVGFGSQALVRDIISGVFFLVDDALRIGDYIEAGKVKGTVEHISVRSVRLRHPRGMIHTVPFSQLGTVTNHSRDYYIEKLDIPLPYEADVDKVRKIVKKINKELQEDPELAPKLLEPLKSQGIKALADSGLVVRIKFKTRPGDNFALRREVFQKLHQYFEEQGIEFATRSVIVRMPQEAGGDEDATASGKDGNPGTERTSQPLLSGAAAAAMALAIAEEEEALQAKEKAEK